MHTVPRQHHVVFHCGRWRYHVLRAIQPANVSKAALILPFSYALLTLKRYIGSIVFCVGCGMLYTLTPSSSTGTWIGYQILAGVGAGACVQIPFIAVQVVLPEKDMPIGNAIAIFFNTLGGALTVSIAQNIFTNTLIQELPKKAPGINVALAIGAGATHFRDVIPPALLQGAIEAYNTAVTTAFITPIAVSGLAVLSTLMFEWKSVKGVSLIPGGG